MSGSTSKILKKWSKKLGLPKRRLKKIYQDLSQEDRTKLRQAIQ